ncbi:prolipoprotein diacylglyceryl transferase [mine drainage metagenome]|uniref:Prolipoprotein diacylglyceryl transferase n=1 Tax=mine drainage metagenome TaxID=410659 RepID=A0A1J5PWV7_9ZZZZ
MGNYPTQNLAFIPTPTVSAIHLGPLVFHFYALVILIGIFVAVIWGSKRWQRMGGGPNDIADISVFVVPIGIIGGRLYHVFTTPELYFGAHGHLIDALKIWRGGMGIWGAVALGAAASLYGHRRLAKRNPDLPSFGSLADALAPGLVLAQAIGRWGNWFNGELFGRPTTLPWGLEIPVPLRPPGYESFATFHPTFLYESLWCVGVAIALIYAERRWKLVNGQVFVLYIALYTLGRGWIEWMRIDDAHHILGLRLNDWVSAIVLIASVIFLRRSRKRTALLD